MATDVSVLAVDPSVEDLLNLSSSLRSFNYQVMTCQTGAGALSLLRKSGIEFQILLYEFDLPDMDGFDLLAAVKSEFKSLQVVLFSSVAGYNAAVVRALTEGACAFYTKPIPMDLVQHLWQFVYKKKIESLPRPPVVGPVQNKRKRDDGPTGVIMEPGQEGKKRLKKTVKNAGAAAGPKKPRLHWSPELCSKFAAAVEIIGIENITVGKIIRTMDKMGVVGLTEPQVSSHLQQYRKRLSLKSSSADSSEPSSSKETSSADPSEPSSSKETSSADPSEPSSSKDTSSADPSEPSSSKDTSSAAATTSSAAQSQTTPSAAAVESYLSDKQLPEISSTDNTTTSQQSSQTTPGAEDFD